VTRPWSGTEHNDTRPVRTGSKRGCLNVSTTEGSHRSSINRHVSPSVTPRSTLRGHCYSRRVRSAGAPSSLQGTRRGCQRRLPAEAEGGLHPVRPRTRDTFTLSGRTRTTFRGSTRAQQRHCHLQPPPAPGLPRRHFFSSSTGWLVTKKCKILLSPRRVDFIPTIVAGIRKVPNIATTGHEKAGWAIMPSPPFGLAAQRKSRPKS
jgi:hypothetical protein